MVLISLNSFKDVGGDGNDIIPITQYQEVNDHLKRKKEKEKRRKGKNENRMMVD